MKRYGFDPSLTSVSGALSARKFRTFIFSSTTYKPDAAAIEQWIVTGARRAFHDVRLCRFQPQGNRR
jgi:hypothetical protein